MIHLVLTTFANADAAANIIRILVEERLVACGTILPGVRSIYQWEGRIEDTQEVMVFLKTSASSLPALQARLLVLHPYETPEILALDSAAVSPAYAEWVAKQTG
jgi:periplasmic divalent cation tolerance protein